MSPATAQFVYRAARGKQWINQTRGIIEPQAFFRRENDLGGLSVAITPQAAAAWLTKLHGMIRIDVQKLSERGFTLVEGEGGHLNICEVPFNTPENCDAAFSCASEIIACCDIVPYP